MNGFNFNIACILAICLASADAKDVDFSTLEVSATEVKNSEKAFSTPGAVSSREDIRSENQSIDSVVRSLPGRAYRAWARKHDDRRSYADLLRYVERYGWGS